LVQQEQARMLTGLMAASGRSDDKRHTGASSTYDQTSQQAQEKMNNSKLKAGEDIGEELGRFDRRCGKVDGQRFILPKGQADSEKEFNE